MAVLRMILFAMILVAISVALFALIFASVYMTTIIVDEIKKLFKK